MSYILDTNIGSKVVHINSENKNVEFENGYFGTIGMESLFGSVSQKLTLEDIIDCLTKKPKQRFDLPISVIENNVKANLTLFDPDTEYVFEKDHILSKSKNSAFLGKNLKGKVYGIVSNNKIIPLIKLDAIFCNPIPTPIPIAPLKIARPVRSIASKSSVIMKPMK